MFEIWDEDIPTIPPRSRLYRLEPVDTDSFMIESLTSYVCRLAYAHRLQTGTLIKDVIAPLIAKPYISNGHSRSISSFLRYAAPVNGNGIMAKDWVTTLEALTYCSDLTQLTMFIWSEAISSRGLLKATKQWCPECFKNWKNTGGPVYEPLLWAIHEVTNCPQHQRQLESLCPTCASSQPWLSWSSQPGYCVSCKGWLGTTANKKYTDQAALSTTNIVGELLTYQTFTPQPIPRKQFVQSLHAIVANSTQGNIAAFARLIGQPKTTVWELMRGKFPPSLPLLLHICTLFNIPLLQLLTDPDSIMTVVPIRSKETLTRQPRRRLDRDKINRSLKEALTEPNGASQSMQTVAQQLHLPVTTIKTHFPEACQNITQRHRTYRSQREALRKEHLKQQIREAANIVHGQGLPLTYQRVGTILGKPGLFREYEARKALQQIITEIESK